jgi:hypothetical protein
LIGCTPAITVEVASEVAETDPALFVAVTATPSVVPTSAVTGVYVAPVAPVIAPQLFPPVLHETHW